MRRLCRVRILEAEQGFVWQWSLILHLILLLCTVQAMVVWPVPAEQLKLDCFGGALAQLPSFPPGSRLSARASL